MMRTWVVVGLALLATSVAAQERVLGLPGDNVAPVFRDQAALNEAITLIRAGVHKTNQPLLNRLLACVAAPGDKGVVLDSGFSSSTIVVTTGKNAGCRGVVVNEAISK